MSAFDVTSASFAALIAVSVFHVAFALLAPPHTDLRSDPVTEPVHACAARRAMPRRARRA